MKILCSDFVCMQSGWRMSIWTMWGNTEPSSLYLCLFKKLEEARACKFIHIMWTKHKMCVLIVLLLYRMKIDSSQFSSKYHFFGSLNLLALTDVFLWPDPILFGLSLSLLPVIFWNSLWFQNFKIKFSFNLQ